MHDQQAILCDAHPSSERRKYIVRRLTPLECCRLQGFPDGWDEIQDKQQFTDEEVEFWNGVRSTYARINGKAYKLTKRGSLLRWYNKLGADSARYKMWGNGIALPCAEFVLCRIANELQHNGQSVTISHHLDVATM